MEAADSSENFVLKHETTSVTSQGTLVMILERKVLKAKTERMSWDAAGGTYPYFEGMWEAIRQSV
jgi:hypothetical protein